MNNAREIIMTAVTNTEDVVMIATVMCMVGMRLGQMATGKEFMSRRVFMHRLHRRALASFSHPSICHSDLYPALGTDNHDVTVHLPSQWEGKWFA